MAFVRVPLPGMPWTQGGHPLERKKSSEVCPVTMLEFAPEFRDPKGCERGHSGFVLSGELQFELDDRSETVRTGEAFHLDPGTRHRAVNAGREPVVLFLVSRD